MSKLKVYRREVGSVLYKDPLDLAYTVRLKQSTQTKTIDRVRSSNNVLEVILNDVSTVTSDLTGEAFADPQSIRVKFSGSPASRAQLKAKFLWLATTVDVWLDEGAMEGFEVSTIPNSFGTGV